MIELLDDPAVYADRAGELLRSSVRHTVLATVLERICAGFFTGSAPVFALVTGDGGEVLAAAQRTPPWGMLCTDLPARDREETADALIAAWLRRDPELPRINAATDTARALADAWARRTGGRHEVGTALALHAVQPATLTDPPRPARGCLRRPHEAETELLLAWELAFVAEAGVGARPEEAVRLTRERIADGRAWVWDRDGVAVSLVGHTAQVAGVPRIGPVYTPPPQRRRGYAGSAVATLSARLFGAGAREIVLFTDLANPTSNRVYADVGYRRIGDWEDIALSAEVARLKIGRDGSMF